MATGKPKAWPDDLRLLRFGVAGEVGDVERERGPVADHAGERREKEVRGIRAVVWNWLGALSMGPKPPALCGHPEEQQRGHDEHEGRGESLAGSGWTRRRARRRPCSAARSRRSRPTAPPAICGRRGPEHVEHGVDGLAADPGSECRTIRRRPARAARRERWRRARRSGARTNTGNGMPYLAPACALSSMGTSTIRLPSRMVPMRLLPVHAAGDEAGRQHVGGDSIDMENHRAM